MIAWINLILRGTSNNQEDVREGKQINVGRESRGDNDDKHLVTNFHE